MQRTERKDNRLQGNGSFERVIMGGSASVKTAINRTMDILQKHRDENPDTHEPIDPKREMRLKTKWICKYLGGGVYELRDSRHSPDSHTESSEILRMLNCPHDIVDAVDVNYYHTGQPLSRADMATLIATLQAQLAEKIEQIELLELDIGLCKENCRNAEKIEKELSDARNEVDRLRRENADIRAEAV